MTILSILTVILLLAFLAESLTEYLFGALADHFPKLTPYKWLIMYLAAAVGVAGAWVYHFDLLHLLGEFVGATIPVTGFGITLTGLVIGRGANFFHDIWKKFFVKPEAV